jgi:hypothetical protein
MAGFKASEANPKEAESATFVDVFCDALAEVVMPRLSGLLITICPINALFTNADILEPIILIGVGLANPSNHQLERHIRKSALDSGNVAVVVAVEYPEPGLTVVTVIDITKG